MLFEEIDRLPERYRMPVILCHLEGLSYEAAAPVLGWPLGDCQRSAEMCVPALSFDRD